jgi:hypothetical protein
MRRPLALISFIVLRESALYLAEKTRCEYEKRGAINPRLTRRPPRLTEDALVYIFHMSVRISRMRRDRGAIGAAGDDLF